MNLHKIQHSTNNSVTDAENAKVKTEKDLLIPTNAHRDRTAEIAKAEADLKEAHAAVRSTPAATQRLNAADAQVTAAKTALGQIANSLATIAGMKKTAADNKTMIDDIRHGRNQHLQTANKEDALITKIRELATAAANAAAATTPSITNVTNQNTAISAAIAAITTIINDAKALHKTEQDRVAAATAAAQAQQAAAQAVQQPAAVAAPVPAAVAAPAVEVAVNPAPAALAAPQMHPAQVIAEAVRVLQPAFAANVTNPDKWKTQIRLILQALAAEESPVVRNPAEEKAFILDVLGRLNPDAVTAVESQVRRMLINTALFERDQRAQQNHGGPAGGPAILHAANAHNAAANSGAAAPDAETSLETATRSAGPA